MRSDFDEMQLLVGRAVTSFGEIEHLLFDFYKVISGKDSEQFLNLNFSQKIWLIEELVSIHPIKNKIQPKLSKKLNGVKSILSERNLIAHNPIMANVYLNQIDNSSKIELSIDSAKNKNKSMSKKDLEKCVKDIEKKAEELWKIIQPIFTEIGEAIYKNLQK
jgi:hypothetical protein